MILKLTQDLSRGFVPWKEMYFENIAKLELIGGKLIFAGSEANDDNKMNLPPIAKSLAKF